MSASAPRSFTSLQGPSGTSFEPPGTRVNIRSDSSRTTERGEVPSALACRARSFTRMSQSDHPGKPLSRLSMIGRGPAEQSPPAWVIGPIPSSTRMRSSPRAAKKSLRLSAMIGLLKPLLTRPIAKSIRRRGGDIVVWMSAAHDASAVLADLVACLAAIGRSMHDAFDPKSFLGEFSGRLQRLIPHDRLVVAYLDDDRRTFTVFAEFAPKGPILHAEHYTTGFSPEGRYPVG